MNAFERRKPFRIWMSRTTGEWYIAAPGNVVGMAPTFRAAIAIMDAWHDRRR
ncbi:hypothetical protein [Kineococcus sp. NPDC059986]|uniref:hypothetical protein n=1 Tax=Kineococcus sp. NPDC059986 TaxID=3155538 RepID=UPI00344FD562